MHFLPSSRPLSELARVFLVSVQPRDAVFPARILSCCPELHTTWTAWLKVLEHILFVVQAYEFNRVGPCRSLLPVLCCNSGRATRTATTAWHFGTVIGNQNLLRLSVLPPFTPAIESFLIELHHSYSNSEVCSRAHPRVN